MDDAKKNQKETKNSSTPGTCVIQQTKGVETSQEKAQQKTKKEWKHPRKMLNKTQKKMRGNTPGKCSKNYMFAQTTRLEILKTSHFRPNHTF